MIRPITALTALLACGAGLYLYQSKHRAHLLDQQIETTVQQANAVRERIRMLNAEWTLLNRPDRLQRLADQFLSLEPTKPEQFVAEADLASRLPPVEIPAATPVAQNGAPAGMSDGPSTATPDGAAPAAGVPVAAAQPNDSNGAVATADLVATGDRRATRMALAPPGTPPTTRVPPADRAAADRTAADAALIARRPSPAAVRLAATRPVPARTMGAARQDPPPPGAQAWHPSPRQVAAAPSPRPRAWSAPPPAPRSPEPHYISARYRPPAYVARARPVAYGAAYRAPPPPIQAGSLLGMAQRGTAGPPPPPAPMPILSGGGG